MPFLGVAGRCVIQARQDADIWQVAFAEERQRRRGVEDLEEDFVQSRSLRGQTEKSLQRRADSSHGAFFLWIYMIDGRKFFSLDDLGSGKWFVPDGKVAFRLRFASNPGHAVAGSGSAVKSQAQKTG